MSIYSQVFHFLHKNVRHFMPFLVIGCGLCIKLYDYHNDIKGAGGEGGGGGGLHQDFLEIDFLVVSDREE